MAACNPYMCTLPGELLETILDMTGPTDYATRTSLSLTCKEVANKLRSAKDIRERALRAARSVDASEELTRMATQFSIIRPWAGCDSFEPYCTMDGTHSVTCLTGYGMLEVFIYPHSDASGYCITDNDGRTIMGYTTGEHDFFFTRIAFRGRKSALLAEHDKDKLSFEVSIEVKTEHGAMEGSYWGIQREGGPFCVPSLAHLLEEAVVEDQISTGDACDFYTDRTVYDESWGVEELQDEMKGVIGVMKDVLDKRDPILLNLIWSHGAFRNVE